MRINLSLILCLGLCNLTLANDEHGGGHAEAPAAEAPAEGHGDAHGSGTALKSTLPAWVEVESKISALEARVKAKEGVIEKLLEEKNHLDSKNPKMKEIVTELTKEHKEMRHVAEELEKEKTILRYRFPERGADPKRKYEKVEVKSLKEMEANLGIDGRLQRTLKRAEQQYGESQEKKAVHKKEENAVAPSNEGSIILQK